MFIDPLTAVRYPNITLVLSPVCSWGGPGPDTRHSGGRDDRVVWSRRQRDRTVLTLMTIMMILVTRVRPGMAQEITECIHLVVLAQRDTLGGSCAVLSVKVSNNVTMLVHNSITTHNNKPYQISHSRTSYTYLTPRYKHQSQPQYIYTIYDRLDYWLSSVLTNSLQI